MIRKIDLLHMTLCDPSDVQKEIDVAREVIVALPQKTLGLGNCRWLN